MFQKPNDGNRYNIEAELRKTFQTATRQYASTVLKTSDHWSELQIIEHDFARQEEELERRYHETYDHRVDTAKAKLLDETGQFELPGLTPRGFGKTEESIEQAAHRWVQQDHKRDLNTSAEAKHAAVEALLERAQAPISLTRAFTHAAQHEGPKHTYD